MSSKHLRTKELSRRAEAESTQIKSPQSSAAQKNGSEKLEAYIEEFIANGLRLQEELMVNHETIAAARREYLAEFQRKRQLGQ